MSVMVFWRGAAGRQARGIDPATGWIVCMDDGGEGGPLTAHASMSATPDRAVLGRPLALLVRALEADRDAEGEALPAGLATEILALCSAVCKPVPASYEVGSGGPTPPADSCGHGSTEAKARLDAAAGEAGL